MRFPARDAYQGLSRGAKRDRIAGKFVENEYEKCDRLMEIFFRSDPMVKGRGEGGRVGCDRAEGRGLMGYRGAAVASSAISGDRTRGSGPGSSGGCRLPV